MKRIFEERGHWYKGNLHMHTSLSDGLKDFDDAVREYHDRGYDFIAVTDHRRPGETMMRDGMLLLSGVEWDTGDGVHSPVFHILGIGMTKPSHVSYGKTAVPGPQSLVNTVLAADGAAFLAHPAWSVMDPAAITKVKGISGAEIYNTVSGLPWNAERADSSVWFDQWASKGVPVPAIAADDAHHYDGDQCVSFIMLNAKDLTRDSLMDALRCGNFYASQGPRFRSILLDESRRVLHLEFSEDVDRAVFYSNISWSPDRMQQHVHGSAEYHALPGEKYVRIELTDSGGRKAWSSPIPLP